jgi:hypothetical protein
MTKEEKDQIDAMDQEQLCRLWRFAECPHPLLQGDTGEYFALRLKEMGGFTPKISKHLDWD